MADVPDHIGPYRTTHTLGTGGMGVVYAGEHLDSGERAAIKTVKRVDEVRLSQIRREIHALTRLRHPGVVRILGSGLDEGRPWYAMEWLQGETLANRLQTYWQERHARGPSSNSDEKIDLSSAPTQTSEEPIEVAVRGARMRAAKPATVPAGTGGGRALLGTTAPELGTLLSLVRCLCEVLAYVHGEGVVHRDLKPSNVFIRGNGLPVLVDFGLAANVGGASGREVAGVADRVAGSVAYMAPEQIRGEMLDARSDLYALGCLLYEVVCGRSPFRGSTEEVMEGHLRGPVVSPVLFAPDLPEPLIGLVLQLLAKERDERLGYAADIARVLADLGCASLAWGEEVPRCRSYLYRPPFVGRAALMERIQARLAGGERGEGGMMVLAGGSGAGKTRLALEASMLARARGMRTVAGECLPFASDQAEGRRLQAAPLEPWHGLMQTIADACLVGGREPTERLLGDRASLLAGHFPALKALPGVAGLPEPAALSGEAARRRFCGAFAETLAAYAAPRPLLLLLDDLQWADELTLALLDHLQSGPLPAMRLVILATLRAEEADYERLESLRQGGADWLEVGRLSGEEVSHMASGMLAIQSPPSALVDFLVHHTDGNPFFVAQYLRMAVAEQMLVRDRAGRWTEAEGLDGREVPYESLPLPRSLREVIERRLRKLSAESRRLLQVAAVMGRRFDLKEVAAVGGVGESVVLAAVDEMALRQVVEADVAGGFRITHDKLRESVIGSLAEEERRGLHRQVAEAYEAWPELEIGFSEPRHAALGYHWAEAGMPEKAVSPLRQAGDRAQELHAVDQAIALYQAALGQAQIARTRDAHQHPEWRVEVLDLWERLGDALALRGQRERAREAYRNGCAEALPSENVRRARLHRKQGKMWETDHDHTRALAAYEAAFAALAENPAETDDWRFESIQAALDRIWVYYWLVRVEEMSAELARVWPEVERRGLPRHRYHYHMCVVIRDYRQHRYRISAETLRHAELMLGAAQAADSLSEIAFARFVHGFGLLFATELERALEELREAREISRRIGDVSSEIRCAAYMLLVLRRSGLVEETARAAEALLIQARQGRMEDYCGVAEAALGWVAMSRGELESAAEWSQRALDTWKGLSFPYPFQWSAALTLLKVQLDQVPLRHLIGLSQRLQEPGQMRLPDAIDAALARAVALREQGDPEGVREALERAVIEAERLGYL